MVLLPVLVVSWVFLRMNYFHQYQQATGKRLVALVLAIALFYFWVIIDILRRKEVTGFDLLVQASFYVYVFSVLTLTGYFILFNQVSAHNWWHTMVVRVERREGVNLQPLVFLKGRHLLRYEVVGNFIMLLPLGIYLPLLYKHTRHFFTVTIIAMLLSVSIELMQLATHVRVTDIDDVILNTAGASLGFVIYYIVYRVLIRPLHVSRSRNVQAYS